MEDTKITVDENGDNCDSQGTLPSTLELVGSLEVDTQPIEEKEEPHAEKHWGTLIPSIKVQMSVLSAFGFQSMFVFRIWTVFSFSRKSSFSERAESLSSVVT